MSMTQGNQINIFNLPNALLREIHNDAVQGGEPRREAQFGIVSQTSTLCIEYPFEDRWIWPYSTRMTAYAQNLITLIVTNL